MHAAGSVAARTAAVLAEASAMAGRALRVFGAAYRTLEPDESADTEGLKRDLFFLGTVSMIDPLASK